jgi:hypothetical protein
VYNERYKTIIELGYGLGYGSASTGWLCQEPSKRKRVAALKVYVNFLKVHRELPTYKRINTLFLKAPRK